MKSLNSFITERLKLDKDTKLLSPIISDILAVIAPPETHDFEEYDKMKKMVSKWVNDNDVKDYDIIISNDDLMAYCGDCEEEFEDFQELVTVDDKQSMDLQYKFKHEQHTCVDKCKYSYPSDWYASKDMLTYNFYSSYLFIVKNENTK